MQFSASEILFKRYREKDYLNKVESNQYIPFMWNLHNAVTIYLENEKGCGTMSYCIDGPLGLPVDTINDRSFYRFLTKERREFRLIEIGAFASETASELSGFSFMMELIGELIFYFSWAGTFEGPAKLVCTVNPAHEKFYAKRLLFNFVAESKCNTVKGAPALLFERELKLFLTSIYGEENKTLSKLNSILTNVREKYHKIEQRLHDIAFCAQ